MHELQRVLERSPHPAHLIPEDSRQRIGRVSLVIRLTALLAAIPVALLAVSGAGGSPAQTPRSGGTARFGSPVAEPPCLNVLLATCDRPGVIGTSVFREEVLASAFEIGPDNTYRESLVSGVDYTTKPPFTLTYSIRPDARWSDGVPISAADFVFTHQAHVSLARKGALSPFRTQMVDLVRRITPVDRKTVRVVLRSRFAGWRGLFANVLPRHALEGVDLEKIWSDRIDNPKTGAPIGSGPFLIERWERGGKLTLRRNPSYFGPHRAYLERLEVHFLATPGERLGSVRGGAVDYAVGLGDPDVVPELRREAGLRILATQGLGLEHFEIRVAHGGHPALENKLVRRALAYGIDRVAILRQIYGDVDPRLRLLDSMVFPTQSSRYAPNWRGYRYRPALARQLLGRAGCRRDPGGVYACEGRPLSLRFYTSSGVPPRARVLSLVQAQLRQVGVEVIPTFTSRPILFGQIIPSGAFDAALFNSIYSPESSGLKDVFGCQGPQNITGYCQRHVTRDLDQGDRILDSSRRAAALNRGDRQLAKDVPVIPLYQFVELAAHRTTLRGVVLTPTYHLTGAENWWLER
jgi:peptide/nickel transport system substrate-binding protein